MDINSGFPLLREVFSLLKAMSSKRTDISRRMRMIPPQQVNHCVAGLDSSRNVTWYYYYLYRTDARSLTIHRIYADPQLPPKLLLTREWEIWKSAIDLVCHLQGPLKASSPSYLITSNQSLPSPNSWHWLSEGVFLHIELNELKSHQQPAPSLLSTFVFVLCSPSFLSHWTWHCSAYQCSLVESR